MTATFKDGDKVSGTVLVGADGPRSSVRDLILGKEKATATPLNIVHSNVAVTYHDAEKSRFVRTAHPVFSMVLHPECFCFISSTYCRERLAYGITKFTFLCSSGRPRSGEA